MPTLSFFFQPSGSSSVYSPSGSLHAVSQPSGSFSLSSSSRNLGRIYNNSGVSESRQRSRSRSPVLVARESSRFICLFRHYASNVVESVSDSVPVPVSDRLRPNIPPLQFAAHEFLPEVAASAAAVAQYRQLRVRRALGVLPSSLILVPGAVSQRMG